MEMAELGRIVVHRGTDPFTPPQSKVEINRDGWLPQPVIKWRRMISEVNIVFEGPDEEDVKNQFRACLEKAALKSLIVGAIAGYVSGGTAAVNAALVTLVASLDTCVEDGIGRITEITGHIDQSSHWSDWE
jgi:hypothetical protein